MTMNDDARPVGDDAADPAAPMEPYGLGALTRNGAGRLIVFLGEGPFERIGFVTFDPNQYRAFLARGDDPPRDLGLFENEHDAVEAVFDSLR
jgi:hypothetical protein